MNKREAASAFSALASANARYWLELAPVTGSELRGWQRRAEQIRDPELRGLAVSKLTDERFNAQVAATLVTGARGPARREALRAVVGLEVAYDYLDGLTELPSSDPLASAQYLFAHFTGALDLRPAARPDPPADTPASPADGGYLTELTATVNRSLRSLPAQDSVAPVVREAASRCAQAQARVNSRIEAPGLESWAQPLCPDAGLGWREFLAGAAASVLCCHALIVAGGDRRTTQAQAERLDRFYLRACALSTLLDALVDRERDLRTGGAWLLALYDGPEELVAAASSLAAEAQQLARDLPDAAHHLMILTGVASYYLSAPGMGDWFARPVADGLRRELSPLLAPTLAVMRAWRAAKRAAGR